MQQPPNTSTSAKHASNAGAEPVRRRAATAPTGGGQPAPSPVRRTVTVPVLPAIGATRAGLRDSRQGIASSDNDTDRGSQVNLGEVAVHRAAIERPGLLNEEADVPEGYHAFLADLITDFPSEAAVQAWQASDDQSDKYKQNPDSTLQTMRYALRNIRQLSDEQTAALIRFANVHEDVSESLAIGVLRTMFDACQGATPVVAERRLAAVAKVERLITEHGFRLRDVADLIVMLSEHIAASRNPLPLEDETSHLTQRLSSSWDDGSGSDGRDDDDDENEGDANVQVMSDRAAALAHRRGTNALVYLLFQHPGPAKIITFSTGLTPLEAAISHGVSNQSAHESQAADNAFTRAVQRFTNQVSKRSDSSGFPPLVWAARHNDLEAVRDLLRAKVDPLVRADNGLSAIIYAIWNGNVPMLELLVEQTQAYQRRLADIAKRTKEAEMLSERRQRRRDRKPRGRSRVKSARHHRRSISDGSASHHGRPDHGGRLVDLLGRLSEEPSNQGQEFDPSTLFQWRCDLGPYQALCPAHFAVIRPHVDADRDAPAVKNYEALFRYFEAQGIPLFGPDIQDKEERVPLAFANQDSIQPYLQRITRDRAHRDAIRVDVHGRSAAHGVGETLVLHHGERVSLFDPAALEQLVEVQGAGVLYVREHSDHKTPLHVAVDNDALTAVTTILKLAGHNSRILGERTLKRGFMPLHYARSRAVAAALLNACEGELKTQVLTALDKDGHTPLQVAVVLGCTGAVEELLEQDPALVPNSEGDFDSNYIDKLIRSAALHGRPRTLVTLLARWPEKLNELFAGQPLLVLLVEQGHHKTLRHLLEFSRTLNEPQQLDVNKTDLEGKTALHVAVNFGRRAILKTLLAVEGIEFNKGDQQNRTPFYLTCELERVAMAKDLLAHAQDQDKHNEVGQGSKLEAMLSTSTHSAKQPLHKAASRGNEDLCTLLLERGAQFTKLDRQGRNAVHHAAAWGRANIVKLFIQTAQAQEQSAPELMAALNHLDLPFGIAESEETQRLTPLEAAEQFPFKTPARHDVIAAFQNLGFRARDDVKVRVASPERRRSLVAGIVKQIRRDVQETGPARIFRAFQRMESGSNSTSQLEEFRLEVEQAVREGQEYDPAKSRFAAEAQRFKEAGADDAIAELAANYADMAASEQAYNQARREQRQWLEAHPLLCTFYDEMWAMLNRAFLEYALRAGGRFEEKNPKGGAIDSVTSVFQTVMDSLGPIGSIIGTAFKGVMGGVKAKLIHDEMQKVNNANDILKYSTRWTEIARLVAEKALWTFQKQLLDMEANARATGSSLKILSLSDSERLDAHLEMTKVFAQILIGPCLHCLEVPPERLKAGMKPEEIAEIMVDEIFIGKKNVFEKIEATAKEWIRRRLLNIELQARRFAVQHGLDGQGGLLEQIDNLKLFLYAKQKQAQHKGATAFISGMLEQFAGNAIADKIKSVLDTATSLFSTLEKMQAIGRVKDSGYQYLPPEGSTGKPIYLTLTGQDTEADLQHGYHRATKAQIEHAIEQRGFKRVRRRPNPHKYIALGQGFEPVKHQPMDINMRALELQRGRDSNQDKQIQRNTHLLKRGRLWSLASVRGPRQSPGRSISPVRESGGGGATVVRIPTRVGLHKAQALVRRLNKDPMVLRAELRDTSDVHARLSICIMPHPDHLSEFRSEAREAWEEHLNKLAEVTAMQTAFSRAQRLARRLLEQCQTSDERTLMVAVIQRATNQQDWSSLAGTHTADQPEPSDDGDEVGRKISIRIPKRAVAALQSIGHPHPGVLCEAFETEAASFAFDFDFAVDSDSDDGEHTADSDATQSESGTSRPGLGTSG